MSNMNWNRLLSLVIALAYLVIAFIIGGGVLLLETGGFLLLPMTAIWYGEELGSFTGYMKVGIFTQQTPGMIAIIGGWILLLMPIFGVLLAVAFS